MGRDKATLTIPGRFDGRTLVEQLVGVLRQRCSSVFVVAAQGQVLPELSVRVLRDAVSGLGPLPALGLGLHAAARAGASRAFVCAVDMPLLSPALIDALVDRAEQSDSDVVLPWDGRDHYLAGLYRTGLAERIDALVAAGERRVGALVGGAAGIGIHRVEISDTRLLFNLNTPDDLARLSDQRL